MQDKNAQRTCNGAPQDRYAPTAPGLTCALASGNAVLWIIIVCAVCGVVMLVSLMGRSPNVSVPERADSGHLPATVQKQGGQDVRFPEQGGNSGDPTRSGVKRVQQERLNDIRTSDSPDVTRQRPRRRQRSHDARYYDFTRPADGQGDMYDDSDEGMFDSDDGGYRTDDVGQDSDVAGNSAQASPA